MKIAFDLDGVLIPDCDIIPNLGDLHSFYELTLFMKPLFTPNGEYSIITARQPQYRSITENWINKYLLNKPAKLYHNIGDESPAKYKERVLLLEDIDLYIESDPEIAQSLRNKTKKEIIIFSEYVSRLWKN